MGDERPVALVQAWRWAVLGSPIDKTAKLVALVIATYMNPAGHAFPSKRTIATEASLSERAVDGAVDRLYVAGLLDVERRRGQRGFTNWQAVIPQPLPDSIPQELPDTERQWRNRRQRIPHLTTTNGAAAAPEVERSRRSGDAADRPHGHGDVCTECGISLAANVHAAWCTHAEPKATK